MTRRDRDKDSDLKAIAQAVEYTAKKQRREASKPLNKCGFCGYADGQLKGTVTPLAGYDVVCRTCDALKVWGGGSAHLPSIEQLIIHHGNMLRDRLERIADALEKLSK